MNKKQPTIYLICGFIGAGKTTFAKKLEEETAAVRVTKDEWSIHFIGNDPTIDGYAEWDRKIIALSRDVAFSLAEKGIDVIMDEGFWEKETRDEMRKRAAAIGDKGEIAMAVKENTKEVWDALLTIKGNRGKWEGKSWNEVKHITYKGQTVVLENYKTVLT